MQPLGGISKTMALLHYTNVEAHRPDVLMKRVFYGLKPFYQFLKRTKKYLESDEAVRRIRWKPAEDRKRRRAATRASDGVWVQLVEPPKGSSAKDSLQAFMGDGCDQVYEVESSRTSGGSPRPESVVFDPAGKIAVLDRKPVEQRLKLERLPKSNRSDLAIRANTWPIHCQLQAIERLRNAPSAQQRPLLRLFEARDHGRWEDAAGATIEESEWKMLTDAERQGTDEQRRFVETALTTPDFAFLDGPPGSGKTTAICELILQLVGQEKRVLLCASTHVAVDNVLERLMAEGTGREGMVIPVRIGDETKVSKWVAKWRLSQFVQTELKRLRSAYRKIGSLSPSQRAMRDALGGNGQGESVIERLVLEAANLVCGTSIGILQHPDLKCRNRRPAMRSFDVLIVDEASKTTFQEFLVPALHAKRWIIVGDPQQLSPYVDKDEMAVNLEACLPDESTRNACVDAFTATLAARRRRGAVVAAEDDRTRDVYAAQCEARGAILANVRDANGELAYADVVVGKTEELQRRVADLPLDVATMREGASSEPGVLRRRIQAWCARTGRNLEPPRWENEVAWRLARLYELRFASDGGNSTSRRLQGEVEDLLPAGTDARDRTRRSVNGMLQVALPSVLEGLRCDFGHVEASPRAETALSHGLPDWALTQRLVHLTTQQRMHPEIAAFSHRHIYRHEALLTPPNMEAKRQWEYGRYKHRSIWIDVRGVFDARRNSNSDEAKAVLTELEEFVRWAQENPRSDGSVWEAAVLTFYRGQEREMRERLQQSRKWPEGQVRVEVCTVDRFQGHEADIVFISFARPRSTSFLESPNRLNVALTRARYQRVIVGNRLELARSGSELVSALAKDEPWQTQLDKEKR